MEKILVWNKVDGDIRLLKIDFYAYIQQQMEQNQFLVYHVCEEELKTLEIKLQYTGSIFPLLQKQNNYMVTNDLEEKCLKLSNYENPDAYNHYQIKDGDLTLVGGQSFIHDAISFTYAKGLHIYTTKTYQDILTHFMKQKQIYEEIKQEIKHWPLEKQKVFEDYFVSRKEVRTYFKRKK